MGRVTTTGVRDHLAGSSPLMALSLVFLLIAIAMPGASTAATIWAFVVGVVAVGRRCAVILLRRD
jgi:hypothetical protein